MLNKKLNRIIMRLVIFVLLLICVFFVVYNYSSDRNSFSIKENKWITDHINTVMDVNIYNDIPLYGDNGSGICFDFLNDFTNDYNIKFNKISYYSQDDVSYNELSFRVLDDSRELSDEDILFYEDHYVVLGLSDDKGLERLDSLDKVGIMSRDKDTVTGYLGSNIQYKEYTSITDLTQAMKERKVRYMIVPNVMYTKQILANDWKILYHIRDLSKRYVLNVKDDTLYGIMKKYYERYFSLGYTEDYSKEYLNVYFNGTNTDKVVRENYNYKIYKYGYVVNMPYENYYSSNFVGTISNYLNEFEKITKVEIEPVLYRSIDDLKTALVSGEVDFALANFDYESLNMKYLESNSFDNLRYVVLSRDNILMNSLKGLSDYKVNVVLGSRLYSLINGYHIDSNVYMNTDELIRNSTLDDIILMDKATYMYYQHDKLADYKVVFEDEIVEGNRFIVNAENDSFFRMFNYYISGHDYMNIRYDYQTEVMLDSDKGDLVRVILCVVIIIASIIILFVFSRNREITKSKDKTKYIDPVTSLKNRNYLNHVIYEWDDNVVFPQAVIVFDVNRLSDVNDMYGREIGDEVLKKVASILINHQMENTDVIRSGGDEFMIYMVGYEKEDVLEYAKSLWKEMKKVSNGYGAEFGYSMILDEVKTVDDAINESIIMMKKSKEKAREKIKGKEE